MGIDFSSVRLVVDMRRSGHNFFVNFFFGGGDEDHASPRPFWMGTPFSRISRIDTPAGIPDNPISVLGLRKETGRR